jgi:DNA-binding NtrC family response regulator
MVGTEPECGLVLSDKTTSKRHFEITMTEKGAVLRDCGSTNGTFVDDRRVVEVFLGASARVRAGETDLVYELLKDEVRVPISRSTNFGKLLGHSPAMRAVFSVLERAAGTNATVLILGESGTGKELAARALHAESARREGPFVVFDCGAVSPNLVESQLFGHVRGAFTGALEARTGAVEDADGGVLVLDEVGELPLELQPKLLRVLESHEIQKVGESKRRPIDVRFVASTNRNLEEEVRAGRFRQDLFYRLSVINVRLPPLRERKEEIPRLVSHHLALLQGAPARALPESLLRMLGTYDWPGNVRELRNFVERFVTLGDSDPKVLIPRPGEKPPSAEAPPDVDLPFVDAKERCIDQFEKEYVARLMAASKGNVSAFARAAGLSRQSCYRLLEKHGHNLE